MASAQLPNDTADLVVDSWQTDAGLSHDSVTAILQTKEGYLWVGTSNGLVRFDGVRFSSLRLLDDPRLRSNRIRCLHEDSRGTLWIGTDDGGLISCRGGKFNSLTAAEGLSSDTVLCLGDDTADDLWVGTASGLNRWRGGRFATFFKTEGLPNDHVSAICQPRGGAWLLATEQGLCQMRGERFRPYGPPEWAASQSNVCCLLADRIGQVWVGGESGLFRVRAGLNGPEAPTRVSSAHVLGLVERTDGEIWFGTSAGDLWRMCQDETNSPSAQRAWHFPSPVTALREDREGNLWAGTARNGLHRLKRRQLRLIALNERLGRSWAPCFFESADGELRLVAGDKGLYRCESSRFALLERLPLPDGVSVQTVCGTRTGGLWIGTLRDGLFEYRDGALRQFSERDGLSDSAIEVLYAEPDGGVWIGTRNGGLNHFKGRVVTRFNTPWGYSGRYACALEEDEQGALWVGTTGDGLFRLWQGQFAAFTGTNGLPTGEIRALQADRDGALWVGTAAGLCRIREGRATAFTRRQGIAEEAIFQLRSDDTGNLWLGSNSGISRVRKDQLNACAEGRVSFLDVVAYGREDGLPGLQCLPEIQSGPQGVSGGWLWFPTTQGLVVARRGGWQWNTLPPAVVLDRVLVDNEEMPLDGSIRVAPGKESLQFQYSALSFVAPGKVRFRYRLEGFDRDWSEASSSGVARYPRVPAGNYRFQVLARNNDGVWNEAGAGVAVVVPPFWWATAWFRGTVAAAVVAILASLYRLRQVRRREIERLRVRIASDLHDDVGSSLWSITLLSRTLAKHGSLGSQERQDVDEIHRIAVQTSNAIRDIIWLINPAFDTMQDLVLRTRDFAGTALRGVEYRLQCEGDILTRKLPLDFRQNLFFLLKEALTNVARHAQATIAEVRIEALGGEWRLSVLDNGTGFDPAKTTGGNGLRNLRARAARMGAELQIRSQPGQGTNLVLTVAPP
jgi:ligand-binding sensor domain-containing protein/signal transduction histidine kinase